MHYIIDGYNFFFRLTEATPSLQKKREFILKYLSEKASELNIEMTIVFDGKEKKRSDVMRTHLMELEIIYTAQNETADDHILSILQDSPFPKQKIIVSSDRELATRAKKLGALVQTIEQFISKLTKPLKKNKKGKKDHFVNDRSFEDTQANIERLLKLFEAKLKK